MVRASLPFIIRIKSCRLSFSSLLSTFYFLGAAAAPIRTTLCNTALLHHSQWFLHDGNWPSTFVQQNMSLKHGGMAVPESELPYYICKN